MNDLISKEMTFKCQVFSTFPLPTLSSLHLVIVSVFPNFLVLTSLPVHYARYDRLARCISLIYVSLQWPFKREKWLAAFLWKTTMRKWKRRDTGEGKGVGKKKKTIRISCHNLLGSNTWNVQRLVGCHWIPKPIPGLTITAGSFQCGAQIRHWNKH